MNRFCGHVHRANEVMWESNQNDLEQFLKIAVKEDIKTLIYEEFLFREELENIIYNLDNSVDELDENSEQFAELKSKLKSYENYSDELFCIKLCWIKDGVCYGFQKLTAWFEEFLGLREQIQEILKSCARAEQEVEVKKSLGETKKKLDGLSKEIYEWAKSNDMKKVTRANLNIYLLDKEIGLTWADKEVLRSLINKQLSE